MFEIARNMGTSVQMIQEYYGKQATVSCLCDPIRGLKTPTSAMPSFDF